MSALGGRWCVWRCVCDWVVWAVGWCVVWRVYGNLRTLRNGRRRPLGALGAVQFRLVRSLVAQARREVPFYRERYGTLGLSEDDLGCLADLGRFPIVTKGDVKANFPDRIASERADRAELYEVATSGTTDRVMLFQDEYKRNWDRAADLLLALEGDRYRPGQRQVVIPPDACYERCGADSAGRTATVATRLGELWRARGSERKAAGRRLLSQMVSDWVWRRRILPALGVDGTATKSEALEPYEDVLRRVRPDVLNCLPMYAYVLARQAGANGHGRLARVIRPGGGKMTRHMTKVVEAGFGGEVRENYGTAELGTIAFDCEHQRAQHLLGDLFYVELLRCGRPVEVGELGEVVITDLRNRVCPLIRYAVGDVGRWHAGPCACGYAGPMFSISGAVGETIVNPAGAAYGGDEVIDFFLMQPGIAFAKVIERGGGRFLVEVVPSGDGAARPADGALSEGFGGMLGYDVQVRTRVVRRISPERSGKYRLVVSTSAEAFHERVGPRGSGKIMGGAA